MPEISIIIPTFNRPEFLKKSLNSVINQSFDDFEAIVINDCGMDASETIRQFNDDRLIYSQTPRNMGLASARNHGLNLARGRYICFLDDDDFLLQNHLQILYDEITSCGDSISGVYTDAKQNYLNEAGEVIYSKTQLSLDWNPDFFRYRNYIHVMSYLVKREVFHTLQGFDPKLGFLYEDYDFLIRFCQHYSMKHIRKTTAIYNRHHNSSLFECHRDEAKAHIRIITTNYLRNKHLNFIAAAEHRDALARQFHTAVFKSKYEMYKPFFEDHIRVVWGTGQCASIFKNFLGQLSLDIDYHVDLYEHAPEIFEGRKVHNANVLLNNSDNKIKDNCCVFLCTTMPSAVRRNLMLIHQLGINNAILVL